MKEYDKKCVCGFPMEPQKNGKYWQHVNGIKGPKCGINGLVATPEEIEKYFPKPYEYSKEPPLWDKKSDDTSEKK